MTAEQARLDESQRPHGALEALGTLPERARLGHGPRGLQPRRHCLGILPARSRALARLPLERGRPRRHLRPPPEDLLRARALERARPDPQGAAVRPHRQRGQPRRGREGVLLLPGQHADALLHEVPVQVSAGGVSVRLAGGREPAPRQEREEFELIDTGVFDERPLLRRRGRVREGDARRHPGADHGRRTAVPRRRGCTCCRRSGSGTPGHGGARHAGRCCGAPLARTPIVEIDRARLRRALADVRRCARAAVHRERNEHSQRCSATTTDRAT